MTYFQNFENFNTLKSKIPTWQFERLRNVAGFCLLSGVNRVSKCERSIEDSRERRLKSFILNFSKISWIQTRFWRLDWNSKVLLRLIKLIYLLPQRWISHAKLSLIKEEKKQPKYLHSDSELENRMDVLEQTLNIDTLLLREFSCIPSWRREIHLMENTR